jgi:molybdopterin-containing oxidoreductase family membrane subunit
MAHTLSKEKINGPLLLLGLVGLAVGTYGIFEALVYRTHATNLTSYMPWGLGVALYLLFLGLSAGGLVVSCLIYLFGMKQIDRISGISTYITLLAEVCAGIAIALDLGRWERLYRFALTPSLTSPMFWMFVFFNGVMICYLFKAWAIYRNDAAMSRFWSLVHIPVSFLFYGTNGYFFSILTSHPAWSGPSIVLWFVLAALLSGGALVAALVWLVQREAEATVTLGKTVLLLLVLFGAFEWLYVMVGYRGGQLEVKAALDHMLFGPTGWSFWLVHVVLGTLIPLALLAGKTDNPRMVALAGLLIVAGFLSFRYGLLMAPQSAAMLPGLEQAWQHPRLALTYSPNLGEWLVTLWVCSLGLLGIIVGPKLFPKLFTRPSWC